MPISQLFIKQKVADFLQLHAIVELVLWQVESIKFMKNTKHKNVFETCSATACVTFRYVSLRPVLNVNAKL